MITGIVAQRAVFKAMFQSQRSTAVNVANPAAKNTLAHEAIMDLTSLFIWYLLNADDVVIWFG